LQRAKDALNQKVLKLEANALVLGQKVEELFARLETVVASVETLVPAPQANARRTSLDMEKYRALSDQKLKDVRLELQMEQLKAEHIHNMKSMEERNKSETAVAAAVAEASLTKKDLDHAGHESAQMREQLARLNAASAAGSSRHYDKKKKKKQEKKGKRQASFTSSDSSGDTAWDSASSMSEEDSPPRKRAKAGGSDKKGKQEKKDKNHKKKMKKQAPKSDEDSSAPE
jgi:hypothetical protein